MRQQEIHYLRLLYIQLTTLFCDWPKAYSEFFNQRQRRHLAAYYTIMKVKCNHRSKFSNLSNWKEEA